MAYIKCVADNQTISIPLNSKIIFAFNSSMNSISDQNLSGAKGTIVNFTTFDYDSSVILLNAFQSLKPIFIAHNNTDVPVNIYSVIEHQDSEDEESPIYISTTGTGSIGLRYSAMTSSLNTDTISYELVIIFEEG